MLRSKAAAQEAWEAEVNKCEELAAKGGFFHSIDPGTAQEDLEADRNEYYKQFISLRYDYSAVELNPRPGYTIHGVHKDDIPIEIKTVTSSEYKDSNNKPTSLKRKYSDADEDAAAHFTSSGSGRRADKLCSRWEYQCCNASSCIGFHG